jgi:hypothetical protein
MQGQLCNTGWTLTPGATLYASGTAGGMTETAPTGATDVVRVVGYALSANTVYFAPQAAYTVVSA